MDSFTSFPLRDVLSDLSLQVEDSTFATIFPRLVVLFPEGHDS
jgi:hypothetical protein